MKETEQLELFFGEIRQYLYTTAVSDILDERGCRNRAMHQRLEPFIPDMNI